MTFEHIHKGSAGASLSATWGKTATETASAKALEQTGAGVFEHQQEVASQTTPTRLLCSE